jgi:glycine betaine/proline transport system substrate-binding protein
MRRHKMKTKRTISRRNPVAVAIIAVVVGALVVLSGPAFGAGSDSKDPIIITLNDWTGQLISSYLMGESLKRMGHNVTYTQADYIAQLAGLEAGDLHVAMELWATTAKQAVEESLKTGNSVDLGTTGMEGIEDWWFPMYVKEKCPGLPDWEALKGCAEVFATPDTAPKGRYLSGAATWGGFDVERIDALGLDFEVIQAGSEGSLFAELKAAYERKAPIILWVWSPHWVPFKYKGEFVKFPPYTDECYNDPSWGINPDKAYDCGKPSGWINKIGWAGGDEKWPNAFKAVRNYRLDNDTMGSLVAEVDLEGRKIEEVVAEWLDNNEDRWKKWFE